jgi:hypothetical protein
MKYFFLGLFLFNLFACSTRSQTPHGIIVIDSSLNLPFFENPPVRSQEGTITVYKDSQLFEYDSINNLDVVINSYIKNKDKDMLMFDSCESYISGDSLIIEYKNLTKILKDKIKIKIIGNEYFPYYIKDNIEYPAIPVSLKFREKFERKGQEIFGELEMDFLEPNTNIKKSFKGPFVCVVE